MNFNFNHDDFDLTANASYIENFDEENSNNSRTSRHRLFRFHNKDIKIAMQKQKIQILKIQNEVFRQENHHVFRLRNCRNQYKKKTQHWKEQTIRLQKQQHIDVDFDTKTHQVSCLLVELFIDSVDLFTHKTLFRAFDLFIYIIETNLSALIIFLDDMNDFSDDREQWSRWKLQFNIKFRRYTAQYLIEWNKIEYVKNHCIDSVFNAIKTKTDFKNREFYFIVDELLKDLNHIFNNNENIQYNKIEQELMNFDFKMINKKIFDEFLICYITTLTFLNYFETQRIFNLQRNFNNRLYDAFVSLSNEDSYKTYVKRLRKMNLHFRRINFDYSDRYFLIKKKLETFRWSWKLLQMSSVWS